jgi:hypothetical protein
VNVEILSRDADDVDLAAVGANERDRELGERFDDLLHRRVVHPLLASSARLTDVDNGGEEARSGAASRFSAHIDADRLSAYGSVLPPVTFLRAIGILPS